MPAVASDATRLQRLLVLKAKGGANLTAAELLEAAGLLLDYIVSAGNPPP